MANRNARTTRKGYQITFTMFAGAKWIAEIFCTDPGTQRRHVRQSGYSKMAARLSNKTKFLCSRLAVKIRHLHTSGRFFDQYKCVAVYDVESFVERCMAAVGTPSEHCRSLAQVLVAGDFRGHFSHGLNRLGVLFSNKVYRTASKWRL